MKPGTKIGLEVVGGLTAIGVIGAGVGLGALYEGYVPSFIVDKIAVAQLPPLKPDVSDPTLVCATDIPDCTADDALGIMRGPQIKLATYSQIGANLVDSMVAKEDNTFFKNDGVDTRSCLRAAYADGKDGAHEGCSSITEQDVILAYKPSTAVDSSWEAKAICDLHASECLKKLNQIAVGFAVDKPAPGESLATVKDAILLQYSNLVPLNNGIIGVEAAAEEDFGVHSDQLNIVQAATIAGIIRNPSNPNFFIANRNDALRQLYNDGYFSKSVTLAALNQVEAQPLGFIANPQPDQGLVYSPTVTAAGGEFLVNDTVEDAAKDLGFANPTDITSDIAEFSDSGDRIVSTYETLDQKAAYNATHSVSLAPGESVSLASEAPDGALDAMIGSNSYGTGPGQSEFNAAQAGRNVGSSLKTFMTAIAIEHGATLSTSYPSPNVADITIPGQSQKWHPVGGECFAATCTLANALAYSSDTVFAYMAEIYGVQGFISLMNDFGMDVPPNNNYSSVLGAVSLNDVDLATGYNGLLRNGGTRVLEYDVQKIDKGNTIVYSYTPPAATQVVSPSVDKEVIQAARGPVNYGTAAKAITLQRIGVDVAGKTGTTDQNTDGRFTGSTVLQGTTSVWAGDIKAEITVPNLYGAQIPAAVFNTYENSIPQTPHVLLGS